MAGLVKAQFEPALGEDLYERILDMIELDNTPNGNGDHFGSAYIAGWYSYVEKDLRQLLGDQVEGPHSRIYCGDGDIPACRAALRSSLAVAIAEPRAAVYDGDAVCAKEANRSLDEQLCFDSIEQSPIGAITQPLVNWQNRPTFQQVVEVDPAPTATPAPAAAAAPAATPTATAPPRRRRERAAPKSTAAPRAASSPTGGGGGDLPFTGLELGGMAGAGALLLLGGWALRRKSTAAR